MKITRVVNVSITRDDIKYGEQHCSQRCPIARAISRHVLRKIIVRVAPSYVLCGRAMTPPHELDRFILPKSVQTFIRLFDLCGANGWYRCEPFTFKLKIPTTLLVKSYETENNTRKCHPKRH